MSFQRADLAVFMIVVVGHAAFNVLFAPWGTPSRDYPRADVVIGAIGVQPVLFARWGALSPSMVKNLPWALVGCVVIAYAQSIRSLRVIAPSTEKVDGLQPLFVMLAAFVAWPALAWAAISILCAGSPAARSQTTEQVASIQFGAATSGCVTALALRICGCRIGRAQVDLRRQSM